jgi:hypothetical protein
MQINSAIEEIIYYTKESSSTLFAGLDLDIPFEEEGDDSLPGTCAFSQTLETFTKCSPKPFGRAFGCRRTGPLLGAVGMGIERAKVDAGLALLAESLAIADKATATAACTLIKEVPEPHARRLHPR